MMVKNLTVIIALCSFVLLIGCSKERSEEIPEKHIQYLESFDWHIKDKESDRTEVINLFPEALQILKLAGLDLEPYKNKEVHITTYLLKEKQTKNVRLNL